MPTLTEEDPEYPAKVKVYCEKNGLKELPWGYIVAHGHLVAVSTFRERSAHALGVVLVVKPPVDRADPVDAPALEPVAGQDAGDGAAAAGVKPADAG